MTIDMQAQGVLRDLYQKFDELSELSISAPDYDQMQIDYLIKAGLLTKIDTSTLSGWAYIVRPTYEGKVYLSQLRETPASKLQEFIQRGEEIGKKEYHPAERGFAISFVSGPLYKAWMDEINIFNERYLKDHPMHDQIFQTYFHRRNRPSAYEDMMGHLRALSADEEFAFKNTEKGRTANVIKRSHTIGKMLQEDIMRCKAFLADPKDESIGLDLYIDVTSRYDAIQEMARTLEKGGFEAIILHEQPDSGLTIIEKIERYADVDFAVVLYTECDLGRAKEMAQKDERYRARQNVVFEHGYLIGKLGRDHVCALVKGNVETPGDISGVVYVSMDSAGAWKMQLGKNMKAVGLSVDLNTFCG